MVDKPLYIQESGGIRAVNEQYPLVDGTRGFTGVVSGVTPTADAHLATKQYVDTDSANHVIDTDTTFHISTTGNDTTGDGSSGSPWATITKALDYLQDKWINLDTTVTIQLADGNHSYSSMINFSHPCGARISIVGTTLVELSLTSVGTISGTAPDRTIVLNVDSTTNCAAGDLIRIGPTSGGTNRQLIPGAGKIVSVNSSTQLTVEWPQQTTSYTPSGSITADITVFKTKISHANHCLDVTGTLGNLNTLALEATGTTSRQAIRAISSSIFCGSDIVIYGAYFGIYVGNQAFVFADGITIGKAVNGLYVESGGVARVQGCIINGSSGISALAYYSPSFVDIAGGLIVGSAHYGLYALSGGACDFRDGGVYGCWRGIVAYKNSVIAAANIDARLMDNLSIYALDKGTVMCTGANVEYGVSNVGVLASRQSYIDISQGTVENNANGINAQDNSTIVATGATVANNTGYNYSPTPVNTIGNAEAYIKG